MGGPHGCGYGNFSVQIIDQVEHGNEEALSECELYWAHQLRAYVENFFIIFISLVKHFIAYKSENWKKSIIIHSRVPFLGALAPTMLTNTKHALVAEK